MNAFNAGPNLRRGKEKKTEAWTVAKFRAFASWAL
jgi:hypothetical protein